MIRINDDWIIDTDPYNYIVKKDLHKQTKQKSGNSYVLADSYSVVGYYGTLQAALLALSEEIVKDKLSAACYSLAEAVEVLKECREEWEKLVRTIDEVAHGRLH